MRAERRQARPVVQQAMDGGGCVFMPTAAPIDVPPAPATEANDLTMIDAALELGKYG